MTRQPVVNDSMGQQQARHNQHNQQIQFEPGVQTINRIVNCIELVLIEIIEFLIF